MTGRRSIQARVLLLVAIGMLGPLAVIAWAGWKTQREFEREVLAERSLLAGFLAARVDALLSSELEALQSAAHEEDPAAAVREVWMRRHALFDGVFYRDRQGRVLAEEPRAGLVSSVALEEPARPAFTDLLGGHAYALAPVHTWNGDFAGTVGGVIDPSGTRLASLFKGYSVAAGESIDLVDGTGAVIASTDPKRLLRESDHAQFIAGLIRQRRSASGSCHGCHEGDKGRVNELIAFSPLSVAHWGISVRQPQTDAFANASGLSRNVLAIAAGLLAVALLFAWGASHSVTRPLATLTRAAERLAQGKLAEPIPRLPEDEVGRLGEALEHMRVALKDSLVRQLLARTLTAQEHERRRVARELHDETSQSLAALVMRIRAALADAPEGPLRAKLIDAAALAVRTLDEVHRMIVDLRPSVLDDLGLKSAIVWYAERNLKTRGIAVRCEFADLDERLPPQHETAVFRVVQEAMNNIARHAGAESVLIQAAVKDGALSVEVEDDGEGFDPSAIAATPTDGRGWGLLGMRERVEMLGGTLRIDSAKGRGTHVALTMPLSSSKETPWTASAS